jgi:hypothetical protein
VCYYKRWMICYLMRVKNVDDTRSIDDGKRDRQNIEGVSHNYRQSWTQYNLQQSIDPRNKKRALHNSC